VSAVVLPNGVRTAYGYDIRSDLVDVRHLRPDNSVMTGFVLQRDALGRIVQADRIGDAPAAAIGDTARSFAYDPANRVLTQTGGADPVTFLFDDNGNLTGKSAGTAVTTCAYDAFSRLMSVSNGTDTTAYAYDAAGRRISKTHNGTETRYHRVGNAVYAFSGGSGEIGSYHIYADSLLYSLDDGGAIRVYHADPRGSVAAVTDSSQNVIQTYDYGPYGTLRTSSGTLLNNPFQYVGTWGVLTDENGLAFMQARYYDPGMGRFLTEDPLGAFPGPNLYAYTQGDPVNRIDPAGLWDGVDMAEGPVDMSDSDESEPLAYTEKPDTKFRIDLDTLSLTPYSLNYPPFNSLPWDYRDAIVSHYAKQDPAKAQELEKIFQKYDEFEDYLQPGTLDFFYRNAPANKTPNCEGCTRSLTGHAMTGEY
ncbi:MAG: RHS repeat-associated core domain-containing protein, partial [Desulfobacterales bacterium]|nr:RHS repeat-associated core domain-containing protein [Desulfobacterales bacterium]